MNKLIASLIVLASTCYLMAAETTNPTLAAKSTAVQKAYMKKFGGFVVQPGSQKGVIAFVNQQRTVAKDEIEKVIATIRGEMKYDIRLMDADSKMGLPSEKTMNALGAEVAIFILEDPQLPSLLSAPDSRWSLVNVATLKSGLSNDILGRRLLAVRARGQLMRAFALACGLGTSTYPNNLLNITEIKELDTAKVDSLVYDMVVRCNAHLKKIGITPERRVMYSRACAEGWAHAPTNEYQKAVWSTIRAEKERGPAKAIQIKP